jgi:hypothetical protein
MVVPHPGAHWRGVILSPVMKLVGISGRAKVRAIATSSFLVSRLPIGKNGKLQGSVHFDCVQKS